MAWLTINNGCWVTLFRVSAELVPSLTSDMSCSVGEIHDYQLIFELHMQVKRSYGQGRCRESSRRRLMLRSRNHLDQNYKLSLHRLIFDGGVGAHQSEAENAVEDQQALECGKPGLGDQRRGSTENAFRADVARGLAT